MTSGQLEQAVRKVFGELAMVVLKPGRTRTSLLHKFNNLYRCFGWSRPCRSEPHAAELGPSHSGSVPPGLRNLGRRTIFHPAVTSTASGLIHRLLEPLDRPSAPFSKPRNFPCSYSCNPRCPRCSASRARQQGA